VVDIEMKRFGLRKIYIPLGGRGYPPSPPTVWNHGVRTRSARKISGLKDL
jgi:hypothetical protein